VARPARGVSPGETRPYIDRMANRWKDWWSQAERDLEHARESAAAERHEWACFAAHQAAEKTA
jgi:HEPN domain-containing protein